MDLIKGKVSKLRMMMHRWQSLRSVPFRRRFFIGYDLDGNSYWEFYVDGYGGKNGAKPRRIVDYLETRPNWVDYKMPPQWVQWLRFARPTHPTLEELHADKVRQEVLKIRVKQAEERWKSIPLKTEASAAELNAANGNAGLEQLLKKHREQEQNKDTNAVKPEEIEQVRAERTEEKQETYKQGADKILKQQQNPSDEFKPTEWSPVAKR